MILLNTFFYLLAAVMFGFFGAICGSFVGVVAERAYTGQSWKRGRSKCNSCREVLEVKDLVPVFSWLRYGGACRRCKARIPASYLYFEVAMGIVFALSFVQVLNLYLLVVFLCAVLVLGFIVLYDLRHMVVPQLASNLLIIISFAYLLSAAETLYEVIMRVVVAACIALFFYALHFFSQGKAMGLGDTPVVFALSLLVGEASIPGVLFSFWVGALVGIGILIARKGGPKKGIEIPFVPFLALGYLLAFFTLWNPLPFVW